MNVFLHLFADAVVIVSILVLLLLFSVQRFGTGKVGVMFAPVLALWFLNLGTIGVYNIVKYDISVVRAFNPMYIYYFFEMNGIKAWSALGGCVLCITGTSFTPAPTSLLIQFLFSIPPEGSSNLTEFTITALSFPVVIVGAEAMFADLGHFTVKSIQVKTLTSQLTYIFSGSYCVIYLIFVYAFL
jgi:K+ transporter